MHALKADTFRQYGRFSWALVLNGLAFRPAYRVVASLRFCQAAHDLRVPWRWLLLVPARLLHALAGQLAGIELPWRTSVGPGLALTHGRGIVINSRAQIGSNVTIFHGVTLGQRDHINATGERLTTYPVIEDNVWLGPYSLVVGGVTIGQGSRIAGGAYVLNSIPARSVVIGNPGRIVQKDCPPDVINAGEFADGLPRRQSA